VKDQFIMFKQKGVSKAVKDTLYLSFIHFTMLLTIDHIHNEAEDEPNPTCNPCKDGKL